MNNKISTIDDLEKLCESQKDDKHSYWSPAKFLSRKPYYSAVFDMLNNFDFEINKSLEIGAEGFFCIKDCVPMVFTEEKEEIEIFKQQGFINYDCRTPNWPIEDKEYDVVIALEVFEHLRKPQNLYHPALYPKKKFSKLKGWYWQEDPGPWPTEYFQTTAFKEIMRISKNAILSFPYMWDESNGYEPWNPHYKVSRETIKEWTCNVEPVEIVNPKPLLHQSLRTVYRWEF